MKAAAPLLRATLPIRVAPFRKLTVPLGMTVPAAGVTVAVRATVPVEPAPMEEGDTLREVLVCRVEVGVSSKTAPQLPPLH